jgi:hypothetical protein
MTFWDWYAAALAAVFVVLTGLSFVPIWQRILVLSIGWYAGGLGIPDALDAKLRRRASIRSRWGNVGAIAGLLLALVPIRLEGVHLEYALLLVVLGFALLGQGIGLAISSLVLQLSAASDGPRIARTRVVVVRDYIPFPLQLFSWLAWGAGCVFAVVGSVSGTVPTQSIAIISLAGLSLILFEIGARAIVQRGQPAGSTDELIWDDALRSSALRDLLQAALMPVVLATIAFVRTGNAPVGPWTWTGVLVVMAFVVAEAVTYRLTRRYYLERLWPNARKRTRQEEAERDARLESVGVQ